MSFSKILIANRGEIAIRVMRTARSLGIRTVAVHSDADARAPHVRFADEAVGIGPPPVAESYLSIERIVSAARDTGADAIHPGYGFLSENAAFAAAVENAGVAFVGPPIRAIEVMGDKARAKRAMIDAGVPCVPGYQGEDQSDQRLTTAASEIGYPLMVKAAAGGGGRGMRLVQAEGEVARALSRARSEAERSFGSGELILERAIVRPRHVEIQVFADDHGNTIHLGERDCSVQRRHQKVIEEAPCPVMTADLRARMGAAAVDAARAVDYRGAGTVEFLLDEAGQFYFLEMNTRLQVEHPVTELVTGLDLVALQLRVAQGEALGIAQEDVRLEGAAIEVRFYAEDPAAGFLPSTGPVRLWHPPAGEGVRVDDGIESGGDVSPYYDAMVAKIIAHGATRDEARRRLVGALERSALFGPKTNRDFLIDALRQPIFASGEATTAFVADTWGPKGFSTPGPGTEDLAIGAALQRALDVAAARAEALDVGGELVDWSSTGPLESVVEYDVGGERRTVVVRAARGDVLTVRVGESVHRVAVDAVDAATARLRIDGRGVFAVYATEAGRTLHLATGPRSHVFKDTAGSGRRNDDEAAGGRVVAPMHGRLLQIFVTEGQKVAQGERLAVLEAMKMQHEILAEIDGTVRQVAVVPDSQLAAGDLLLEIEPVA